MDASIKPSTSKPQFEFLTSRQFTAWMTEKKVSLAFTTYQAGKLFLLGTQPNGKLDIFNRTFERCMGLCVTSQTLWLSSLYQFWRFENALQPGQIYQGYDRLYVPQMAYTTGDLDIHDVVLDTDKRPVFVNTLFSCLATVSETHSFKPLWQPSFVSRLAAEDRCHLNGLAMQGGEPRYVTAVSRSDVADGWRDHRQNGGVVIDVKTSEVILDGLSMPHSPRLHQGKLWLLDSGRGEFGYVDRERGTFEPVAFIPGYARGLSLIDGFAVVGVSKPRNNTTFSGLQLDQRLQEKKAQARCGLYVIDLNTGDAVHWLRIEGVVDELYDVAVLPNIQRPMAIGLQTDEIRRVLSMAPGETINGR